MKKTIIREYLELINIWHTQSTNSKQNIRLVNKLNDQLSELEDIMDIDFLNNILYSDIVLNDWQKLRLAETIFIKSQDIKVVTIIKSLLFSSDIYTKWDAETFFMLNPNLK